MYKTKNKSIERGFQFCVQNAAAQTGSVQADDYIKEINRAIDVLNEDINAFEGFHTDTGLLKGDVAEFYHSDTFNINAILNGSKFKTVVDRSHDFASADVTSNWGEEFGLKYLKNAQASANAQSTSYFQRFCEYKTLSGRTDLSFEEFLLEKNINPEDVLKYNSIYNGQVRVIPRDQLQEAIEYLKYRIAKETGNRPEQVAHLQETLDKLTSRITAPDGTTSIELSREEAEEIARLAKQGKFDARDFNISTDDLVQLEHIIKQGVKSGMSAAVISFVLKTAPEMYKCLEQLIQDGEIDEERFKKVGFAALSGSSEGFMRGFVSASLTTACKSGALGAAVKSVNPNVIAALTVIMINMAKDSFYVVKGTMSRYEMTENLSRNIFVTSCALGLGSLTQILLPMVPGAYLLGNFVGSFVGSFAYVAADNAIMSFCIESGWTLFGLVKQDYQLPNEIIRELGFDLYEVEEFDVNECQIDEYQFDDYQIDEYEGDFISVIRRGVIGVHQIGYV